MIKDNDAVGVREFYNEILEVKPDIASIKKDVGIITSQFAAFDEKFQGLEGRTDELEKSAFKEQTVRSEHKKIFKVVWGILVTLLSMTAAFIGDKLGFFIP